MMITWDCSSNEIKQLHEKKKNERKKNESSLSLYRNA